MLFKKEVVEKEVIRYVVYEDEALEPSAEGKGFIPASTSVRHYRTTVFIAGSRLMIEMRWVKDDPEIPDYPPTIQSAFNTKLQYRQWISQGREFWTEWTDVPFVGVEDE